MIFGATMVVAVVASVLMTSSCAQAASRASSRRLDPGSPVGGLRLRDMPRCERIVIPFCANIGYNLTSMPNPFLHTSQHEVQNEVSQFEALVKTKCSEDLRLLLCSYYTPICMPNYMKPVPACRQVCERARTGCEPYMKHYGFPWPERMQCEDLPRHGDPNNLCMDFNRTHVTNNARHSTRKHLVNAETRVSPTPAPGCQCRCRSPMVVVPAANVSSGGEVAEVGQDTATCAIGCDGPTHFGKDEMAFARYWIIMWACLCLMATLATVTTYLVDRERFSYPQRPVVFIGACYAMVSAAYLLREVNFGPYGDGGDQHPVCAASSVPGAPGRARDDTMAKPMLCIVQFVLVYFFGSAACLWWVVLSLTWFLAAGLKWAQEAIENYSCYFHACAWCLPCLQTALALAFNAADADSMAGICSIGNLSLRNLRLFVIMPYLFYLAVGICFLLAGFVSLFRIRNVIKNQGRDKTATLEKLMMRIGVFSLLYTVPATAVVTCSIYEHLYRAEWQEQLKCACEGQLPKSRPDFPVFMLKYFASLVVGITSGFWVWSGKTLTSWRRFLSSCPRCPGCRGSSRHLDGSDCTASTSTTSRSLLKVGVSERAACVNKADEMAVANQMFRAPVEGRPCSASLPSNEALLPAPMGYDRAVYPLEHAHKYTTHI